MDSRKHWKAEPSMTITTTTASRVRDTAQPWMMTAACADPMVDPEWFHPIGAAHTHNTAPGTARAKKICASCPVREACLAAAETHGIWGGTTQWDRWSQKRRERHMMTVLNEKERANSTYLDECSCGAPKWRMSKLCRQCSLRPRVRGMRMLAEGASTSQVMAALGVHVTTVRRWRRERHANPGGV